MSVPLLVGLRGPAGTAPGRLAGTLLVALLLLAARPGGADPLEQARTTSSEARCRQAVAALEVEWGGQAPPELRAALARAREGAWPHEARAALARAQELFAGWQGGLSAPSASEAGAREGRERLRAILARPEFTRASRVRDLLGRLEQGLARLLERLLPRAGLEPGAAGLFQRLLLGALVALVALGVGVALVALLLALRRVGRPGAPSRPPQAPHEARDLVARGWLDLAEEEAARGDYLSALRSAYLALLRRLDERELLRLDRDRTNWELVGQLPPGPAREDLVAATRLFESRWYAGRPAEAGEYSSLRETVSRWE